MRVENYCCKCNLDFFFHSERKRRRKQLSTAVLGFEWQKIAKRSLSVTSVFTTPASFTHIAPGRKEARKEGRKRERHAKNGVILEEAKGCRLSARRKGPNFSRHLVIGYKKRKHCTSFTNRQQTFFFYRNKGIRTSSDRQ